MHRLVRMRLRDTPSIVIVPNASEIEQPAVGANDGTSPGIACPICTSAVGTGVETCERCGWPVKWILAKSGAQDSPRRPRNDDQSALRAGTERSHIGPALLSAAAVAAGAVLLLAGWWRYDAALDTAVLQSERPRHAAPMVKGAVDVHAPSAIADLQPPADVARGETRGSRPELESTIPAAPDGVVARPATGDAPGASASDAVQAWRTAEGKLYFGSAPPAGSEKMTAISPPKAAKPPTAALPAIADPAESAPVAVVRAVPAQAPARSVPVSYAWRTAASCKSATTFDKMRIQVDPAYGEQTITAVLKNIGTMPIKDVTVCRRGACALVEAGRILQERESAPFTLLVPQLDWSALTVECSVLEARQSER